MPGTDDPERSDSASPEDRSRRHAERMRAARASAMGFQFAISIILGAFGGSWLDKRFGTGPWLLLLGVVLGAVAAFRDLAKLAREQQAADPMNRSDEEA